MGVFIIFIMTVVLLVATVWFNHCFDKTVDELLDLIDKVHKENIRRIFNDEATLGYPRDIMSFSKHFWLLFTFRKPEYGYPFEEG